MSNANPFAGTLFRGRRALSTLSMAFVVTALAACAQVQIEDAVPEGAATAETYPDLNKPASAATSQLSSEEASADKATLAAARARAGNGQATNAEAEAEQLRRLRERHGDDALREIEGS